MRRRLLFLVVSATAAACSMRGSAGEPQDAPASTPATARAEPGALTLAAACRLAGEANNEVLAARMESAAELERTNQAKSRYWPRLELIELYRRTNDPSIRPNFLIGRNELADTERLATESYRTEGGLTYTLFDGGARSAALRSAEAEFSASMRTAEAVRSGAIAATADAFLAAIYAERELAVAREEAARMADRLKLAKVRQAQGRALDEEVLMAEYRLERAGRQVLAAGNSAASARETLGRLLGRTGQVTEPLAEGTDNPLDLSSGTPEPATAETQALGGSPELARSRILCLARQAAVDAERAAWWPKLEASASRYYEDESFGRLDAKQDSYIVGVQLSWPLFDGGLRRARVAEARSREAAAAYRASEAEMVVSQRARDAARTLAEAERGAAVAARRVAAYDAVYKRLEKSWEAGRASFGELLEAQTDLADSRLAELGARFDARRATARLLETTGFWANW